MSDVFSLSKAEAALAYLVELDAVVLYSDPEWGSLFFQDQTGSTYIDIHGTSIKYPEGTRIHMHAVTTAVDPGPTFAQAKITVLGRSALPKPEQRSIAELDAGAAESHRVITECVLHPCDRDWRRVCFRIHDGKNLAWIFMPQPDGPSAQRLVGVKARVTGVVARHLEGTNERVAAELYLNSLEDIQVETPPLPGGFSSPPMPIHALRLPDADQRFVRQNHSRGTVTWQSPGLLYMEDNSGVAFVETRKDVAVHVGDTVDAIGFPSRGAFGPELADSAVRVAALQSNAAGIVPLPLTTAAEVVKRSLNGKLVRVKARLISQSANDTEIVYQLDSEGQRFNAVLLRSDATREIVGLTRDSVLELQGIALIQGGTPQHLSRRLDRCRTAFATGRQRDVCRQARGASTGSCTILPILASRFTNGWRWRICCASHPDFYKTDFFHG